MELLFSRKMLLITSAVIFLSLHVGVSFSTIELQ